MLVGSANHRLEPDQQDVWQKPLSSISPEPIKVWAIAWTNLVGGVLFNEELERFVNDGTLSWRIEQAEGN